MPSDHSSRAGPTASIPDDLARAIEARFGRIGTIEDRSWDHGEATVLRVDTASSACFVKLHRTADHYQREVHAYRTWVTGWPDVPTLVGNDDRSRALAVTEVPGVSALDLDVADRIDVHHRAGAFLARMHAIGHTDDDIPLDEAVAQRLESWSARALEIVDAQTIDWVRRRVDEILPMLAGQRRVVCHRDYTERNWIVDGDRLWVFDFGISRPDIAVTDIERIWSSTWRQEPALQDAFWDGYGRRYDDDEVALLEAYGVLQALTTVVWAVEHNDAPFEAAGRERLEWLRASP